MLMIGLHQKQKKRVRTMFMVSVCMIIFLGCSQSNVEAPDHTNNIWGFGNIVKNKSNTFESNTASIADAVTFNYWNQNDFFQQVQDNLTGEYQGIYQSNYQQGTLAHIEEIKNARTYSLEHPLLIQNPFGTNQSSLYVYFGAPTQRIILYYTVSAADETIPDFTDTMYINLANATALEGQIVGLIAGQQNKIVFDIRDDSGSKISKKAYIIDVPAKSSNVDQRLNIETADKVEFTRGLFTYLVKEGDSSYFVFYDNNGILRSEIPTYVKQSNARILQTDNLIFYEFEDNQFALVNNLGHVINTYSYEFGENITDYDYDSINKKVLVIAENNVTHARDKVVALNLESGEWSELIDFKRLLRKLPQASDVTEGSSENASDWVGLSYVFAVEGKDAIVLSKELNSIIRVNNIYSQPVIRWIIGNSNKWKNTDYESLLLTRSGNKANIDKIDSLAYFTSKKLKEGQHYLSFINSNKEQQPSNSMEFGKYLVDENQNKYRIQQSLAIPSNQSNCSGISYGTHAIIAVWDEHIIVEYNEKGEIMLRMILPNTNSSYRIYKYTMDRYWF